MSDITYISWGNYAVSYHAESRTFDIDCKDNIKSVQNIRIADIFANDTLIGDLSVFTKASVEWKNMRGAKNPNCSILVVTYSGAPGGLGRMEVRFTIGYDGIDLQIRSPKTWRFTVTGDVRWGSGDIENTYPMSSAMFGDVIRCASGPAASRADNMLFDRLTDTAIRFDGPSSLRLYYDWSAHTYAFRVQMGITPKNKRLHICAEDKVLRNQYPVQYAPVKKNGTFGGVPIGWMTWYAVQFDACEELVLKNAEWMHKHLKPYGANSVWVDWEWGHKDFEGSRSDGTDAFHPDITKYPNGLKYVADKIKELGFKPVLWIGFTVESDMNAYLKANPEIILADDIGWCGRYYMDFSHPKFLNEYLPKALDNVKRWGYEAVKIDCLPFSMNMHEKYHSNMYDPSLTTMQAYRSMIKRTRELLGDDVYMLACSGGANDRNVLWAADIFDAARAGDDIFEWEYFLKSGIDRVLEFYPLHNNLLYIDCDNVVLREAYNNLHQAASRLTFVSMLGLPVTFGDSFDALDERRINLIKRCIPVLDIHPMEAFRHHRTNSVLKINLLIERQWEQYNVLNVLNATESPVQTEIDLQQDLMLEPGEYLVFDYLENRFLGIKDSTVSLTLDGFQSSVLGVRIKTDIPQILSTSRHISQGATEIENVHWDSASNSLSIEANVIAEAPYTITLYVPSNYTPVSPMEQIGDNVWQLTVQKPENTKETFIFRFDVASL